jgi:hypothetical protein
MGLQQFERRLERLVEGVFARAFRSGLQPVEVGRRLSREMDLRRQVAPKGTLAPNQFVVSLSPEDRARFDPIEDELINELISVAKDHAVSEDYSFVGPVSVAIETDDDLSPGMLLISGEMSRSADGVSATLTLPDGRRIGLGARNLVIGRLPECDVVLSDPNISRRHAEVRPAGNGGYEVVDLGSTNGTKLNGVVIRGPQLLRDRDVITVGATSLRYEQG